MKVLILGGSGMLGHKLWQVLSAECDTWVTLRSDYGMYARYHLFARERVIEGIDIANFDTVLSAAVKVHPDIVVNAVGIVKQLATANDPIASLTVNALFPHRLARLCQAIGARLIHVSTDCVFSGRKGMYTETDFADCEDLYGRTKLLGEVSGPGALTVRTSIIGRELVTANGLVEWFLRQRGRHVRGYRKAIFSGFPTVTLARVLANIVQKHPDLSGLWHISSAPISKYDLLCHLREAYDLETEIEAVDEPYCDRSLDSSGFRRMTGFSPPSWPEMIAAMVNDRTPYDTWRRTGES